METVTEDTSVDSFALDVDFFSELDSSELDASELDMSNGELCSLGMSCDGELYSLEKW